LQRFFCPASLSKQYKLFEDVATFEQEQASDHTQTTVSVLKRANCLSQAVIFKVSGTIYQELL